MNLPAGIEPQDYVTLGRREADSGMFGPLSTADYRNLRALTPSTDWAYFSWWASPETVIRSRDGARTQISVRSVSANYLDLLGVKPVMGSVTLGPDGSGNAAVISEDLWRRFFGRDPDVLGSLLVLEDEDAGRAPIVVGVAARGFVGAIGGDQVDAWKLNPTVGAASLDYVDSVYLLGASSGRGVFGGPSLASVLAPYRFQPRADRLGAQATVHDRVELVTGIELLPDRRAEVHDRLAWLGWLVALLLVLAFTTLVDFLIAEHRRSRDDQAIRIALGASPQDVFLSDLGTYSVWIGATALVMAGAFGYGADLILAVAPFSSYIGELRGVSATAGLGVGMVALALTFVGAVAKVSREVSQGAAMPLGHLAVSRDVSGRRLLLFVAAANLLLVLSLAARHWAEARLALPFEHDDAVMLQILDGRPGGAEAALSANPAVLSASATEMMPLLTETVEGRNRARLAGRMGQEATVYRNRVGTTFFGTLGLDIVAGRVFDGVSPSETVVSRATATRLFGEDPEDALGQSLAIVPESGGNRQEQRSSLTVVGVVEDLPYQASLDSVRDVVYTPDPALPQEERWLVRHVGPDRALIELIEERAGGEVFRIGTIREIFREQYLARRSVESILAVAAAFAALLAMAGVAGSLAKWITASRRSIGIRLVVGGTVWNVTLRYAAGLVRDLVAAGAVLCAVVAAAKWASPALSPMIDLRFLPVALIGLTAMNTLVAYSLVRHMARHRPVDELVEGG